MRWWPRRPRPRSLRGRLVLLSGLLATGAVVLCQAAGLTVMRGWLTDEVDERLAHFRPPDGVYRDIADGRLRQRPRPDNALPSDYRVSFYGRDGRLLDTVLGHDDAPGPRLPDTTAELEPTTGRAATVGPADGSGSDWRVIVYAGPDGMRAVVALPLDTVDGATTRLLWFSVALGTAVAVGVGLLGNLAVRVGLRPLTRVERTAQRITDGALRLSVPVPDPDTEVGRLSLALNTMLDRLRAALHRAEDSERQLRRFLADAGHELRTPLTAVQGFAELLLHEPDMSDERRHEAHGLLSQNAERVSRLVDDLFLLAALGRAPHPHQETVDLLSLCADAIATTALRHPRRAISLEPLEQLAPGAPGPEPSGRDPLDRDPLGTGAPGVDPFAVPGPVDGERDLDITETTGDPHRLAQVVGNLLTNAVTHTSDGTRLRVRVGAAPAGPRHGADRPGRVATGPPPPPGTPLSVVEVVDDGPGLAPEDAARVFDRFYRAGPSRSPMPPGSGLGLAIAAAIATAHHGRLELDTAPGRGSVFRLVLPGSGPGRAEPRPGHVTAARAGCRDAPGVSGPPVR
ncbi:sensor histidine kinase [Streptomyces sp. JNUCC 64]